MRIYLNPFEAVKEVERDLWEMGIEVLPRSMQDKVIENDDDYATKEIRGYGYRIMEWPFNMDDGFIAAMFIHIFDHGKNLPPYESEAFKCLEYIKQEIIERTSGQGANPGNAYIHRQNIWDEFLHNGKFAYTYAERMAWQVDRIYQLLTEDPDSRQAIINIHSYICPFDPVTKDEESYQSQVFPSADFDHIGGKARIPCSMYYQLLRRKEKLDLIYTMRSCDLLTHFPIDMALALMLQKYYADRLGIEVGTFTHFIGSLHAYRKDMKVRGIF